MRVRVDTDMLQQQVSEPSAILAATI